MRRLALLALVVVAAGAAYLFLIRDEGGGETTLRAKPVATLGEGEDAVAIAADGRAIRRLQVKAKAELPALPDAELPANGRVAGPMLEQVRVLAATPAPLRPYVERSAYGERGVVVVLTSGIELLFGDASQAKRKWRAAAAVLADPTTVAVGYVNLLAPSRPSTHGSDHLLPPPP